MYNEFNLKFMFRICLWFILQVTLSNGSYMVSFANSLFIDSLGTFFQITDC